MPYHLQFEIFIEDQKLFQHFDNESDVMISSGCAMHRLNSCCLEHHFLLRCYKLGVLAINLSRE